MKTTPTRLLSVLAPIMVASVVTCYCAVTQAPPAAASTTATSELSSTDKYTSLPAFPGAEGFGMYVTGGRGGTVYEVTNTQDYNPRSEDPIPGSLRDAVSQDNRTIIFRVSGTIQLKSQLNVTASNITIAGQTAPGDGICTRDYPFGVSGHNIIVRYMRGRLGDVSQAQDDSIDVNNGAYDIIIDHCSATWSVDECLSTSGDETRVSIQWCLIGQSLCHSVHAKGDHGYGSLARSNGNVSWLHNLWVHNIARNPRLGDYYGNGDSPFFDVRNNVIYDYGETCSGLTQGYITVNYLNNYIRPGPSSSVTATPIHTPPQPGGDAMPSDMTYYIKGNVVEGNATYTANNTLFFNNTFYPDFLAVHFSEKPVVFPPPYHVMTAEQSYEAMLPNVGATLPSRDRVDAAIIQQVRDHSGSIIDTQTQAGSWPELKSATAPVESLHDGIPDAWKTAHGLDLKDTTLASKIDQNGYTYLEEYLNGTDPRVKVDYLDPKNNLSSLKPGPTQALWVPTPAEAADIAALAQKYHALALVSYRRTPPANPAAAPVATPAAN